MPLASCSFWTILPIKWAREDWRSIVCGQCKTKVLHSFGRADQLDMDVIRRLVDSLSRLLPEEEGAKVQGSDVE